jgi:Tol biopolymer transport system component
MKRATAWLACAALAAASTLAACSARTPVDTETPRPTGSLDSPSPTATSSAVRAPVARSAVFAAADGLWLYDVKTNAVTQLARGTGIRSPKWASSAEVAFLQDQGEQTTLRLFDARTKQVTDLFSIATGIRAYGLSPDKTLAAYITTDSQSYPHLAYRFLAGGGGTQTVATLARAPGRGVDPADQTSIEFSPDGQSILVVYTFADGDGNRAVAADASQFQIRGVDGSLVFAATHRRDPTMGFWSPDGKKVYYRTDTGARVWTAKTGTSEPLKGGVKWFDPSISRDGKLIAYDSGAYDAKVHVEMLTLKTAQRVSLTKGGFYTPVFANARTVWVQRAQPCKPDCAQAVSAAPEVDAVDVVTGVMTKIALPTLQDLDVLYA